MGGGQPPAGDVGPILAGGLGGFTRPTERPNEPVTAGLPFGPGPGRESLEQRLPQPVQRDPDLEALRPYLGTLELLASQPDTSIAARNFIRRIRGGMPPSAQD